jgi:hypothetical protein
MAASRSDLPLLRVDRGSGLEGRGVLVMFQREVNGEWFVSPRRDVTTGTPLSTACRRLAGPLMTRFTRRHVGFMHVSDSDDTPRDA